MKKILLAAGLLTIGAAQAQITVKDVFSGKVTNATWLGLDFTQAKIINDPATNPKTMVDQVYESINGLTQKEFKKYDVKGAFKLAYTDYDFSAVNKHNGTIDASTVASTSSADAMRLKASDVAAVVQSLTFTGKKGLGILYVVEGLDKVGKQVTGWIVLVNLDNKQILLSEYVPGKTASGFGERNYWASGFKGVLNEIEEHKYKEWKKTYGS
jgi:hypothetical protein